MLAFLQDLKCLVFHHWTREFIGARDRIVVWRVHCTECPNERDTWSEVEIF